MTRLLLTMVLTSLALSTALLGGCGPAGGDGPGAQAVETGAARDDLVTSEAAPSADAAGPSLYDLSLDLLDQHGEQRDFDTFRGHPTVLAMFYATCPSACPVMMNEIRRFEDRLPERARLDLRVLLVSLDPERDEPSVLAAAARRHHADPNRWALCRASDDDVLTLASVLGVRYRPDANGEIDHSSAVVLLSADGRPLSRVDGLGAPLDPFARALGVELTPP